MSEAAVLPRSPVEASHNGSILIIDDEAAIRESLETLLEFEGYSVESAETGAEGLARLNEKSFDLVLLDFALPDRNGLELLTEIRARDAQLAVIMITAYGTVENAVRARREPIRFLVRRARRLDQADVHDPEVPRGPRD